MTEAKTDPFADTVRELDFMTAAVQRYDHRPYHDLPRVCHYTGVCSSCNRRTYAFDDGQNDPRGPLGDHANSPLDPQDYPDRLPEGVDHAACPEVPLCSLCANEEGSYKAGLAMAERQWSTVDPITMEAPTVLKIVQAARELIRNTEWNADEANKGPAGHRHHLAKALQGWGSYRALDGALMAFHEEQTP